MQVMENSSLYTFMVKNALHHTLPVLSVLGQLYLYRFQQLRGMSLLIIMYCSYKIYKNAKRLCNTVVLNEHSEDKSDYMEDNVYDA
jgi:hypothetical protein